ncbi:hypothetical protein CC117_30520 [Parafrankia colletiae]|uniref:Uncharacterized protein n=1 Tax=Parafrankia colletiae TaxID=573497 RepID=A0A1S1Q4D4_9ACTN|nr:hypothetical protein [Parafrankia colletiae]MCK9904212.1 hypothetical protein [Frankia sp. Cpl3]OHV28429.1 hypothetical protein CC117_30520 [Parafrankia colletiae]
MLGTEALLCFDLDRYEHSRRRRAGLGAVVDVGVLDLLLGLPPGRPIDRMGLGGRERRAVAKAPPGCLRVDDRSVIRLARPLVKVEVAVISTRGWRRGLEQAGRFAPFCARAIVLDRAPRDLLAACVEADFYGVGLFLAGEGSPVEMLVAPEPCRAARVSARTWWFTEEVYRAHLAECPIAPGRAASSERA